MYGQMLESKETACREEDRARIHPIVDLMQLLSNSFDLFFSEGKQAGMRFKVLVLTTAMIGSLGVCTRATIPARLSEITEVLYTVVRLDAGFLLRPTTYFQAIPLGNPANL
jgi:hypothetical protein